MPDANQGMVSWWKGTSEMTVEETRAAVARLARIAPYTNDPVQRLGHTLEVFAAQSDDDWVTVATSGYGSVLGADRTGITWGDLRAIYRHMSGVQQQQRCQNNREVAYGKLVPCWNRAEAGKAYCPVCELLLWTIPTV